MQNNLDTLILAYALKEKTFAMEISNSVSEQYLMPQHRWLYNAITSHFTNPKFREIPSKNIINEFIEHNFEPEDHEKHKVLYDQAVSTEIDPKEFTWHFDKLKKRYNEQLQRKCIQEAIKVIKTADEESLDKVNQLMRQTVVNIDSIYRRESYEEGSLDESAKKRAEYYNLVEANPELAQGILTGFSEFDRITNGLHQGELMIIAGATGTGKSVVMHNIAVNAYLNGNDPTQPVELAVKKGFNVLYFSLEMPKSSMERRVDSCMGDLFYNQIRDGALDKEAKEKYFKVLKFQSKYEGKFHIVDMPKGATAREIELKYLEMCETKFKPDIVFVDYVGIMSPNDAGDSDWLALGKIAADMHEFARTYDIPVITGSQVNRLKDPTKQRYGTDRVARSDMVTNNANIIVQIGCRDDEDTRTDMPMYITKMRDGEKGSFVLSKYFPKMKVVDLIDETFVGDDDDLGI